MKYLLIAVTLILGLSVVMGGVLVSAANAAAPGSPLYAIDRGVEGLQRTLAFSQESSESLEARLAVERLEEVQALLETGEFEYLGQALAEAGLVSADPAVSSSAAAGMAPEVLDGLLNAAFQAQLQQDGDENENEDPNDNGDENENDGEDEGEDGDDNGDDGEDSDEDETFKQPKNGVMCAEESDKNQPAGEKLAEAYSVEYSAIMDWFCGGYGFGEINLAYLLNQKTGASVEEIFDLRGSGVGWGTIMQDYGLIGKDAPKQTKEKKKDNKANKGSQYNPSVTPTPQPAAGNGKSNGKGNNKSNNGKGKGKP